MIFRHVFGWPRQKIPVGFGLLCCVWSAIFFTAAQFDNYRRNQLLIEQKPTVRFSFKPEKKTVDRTPSLMDAEKLTIGQKL